MKILLPFFALILLGWACNETNKTPKEKFNIFNGIDTVPRKKGAKKVKNALDCDINFSPKIADQGILVGEYYLLKDTVTGMQNRFQIEMFFHKDFNGKIRANLINKDGKEVGRVTVAFKANHGDFKIIAFPFGPKIPIPAKSIFFIEKI